jgi:hypothetical protein
MGLSLLLLGIFLLLSQLFDMNMTNVMLSWWPIILIVLGLEILAFLFFSRTEKPLLKYDFLSIIFVGIIGTVGIGFAVLNSVGFLDLLDEALDREQRTYDLPPFSKQVDGDVKRIVLNAPSYPITVEGSPEQDVSVFGTYDASAAKGKRLVSEVNDYISMHQEGDTLFLTVKGLPARLGGPFSSSTNMDATVLIPENIDLEISGKSNSITMKPRTLASDWKIDNGSDVNLVLEENSDVEVSAIGVQELHADAGKWVVNEVSNKNEATENTQEYSPQRNGNFKTGKGTHKINILNAYQVRLSTVQ